MRAKAYFVCMSGRSNGPDYIASSVASIDFGKLYNDGIRTIVFDVDGTLTANKSPSMDDSLASDLRTSMNAAGIEQCLVASNSPRPLSAIADQLGAKAVVQPIGVSAKPSRTFYAQVIAAAACEPRQIAMIGDRRLQDIWGAKRSGMRTVLVSLDRKYATTRDTLVLRHIWQPWLIRRKKKFVP